jgi:cytochrome c553
MSQVLCDKLVAVGLAAAAAFLISPATTTAADLDAGKSLSQTCVACHGPGGNSITPGVPSISGNAAQAISMQLYNYREGNRKNAQMTPMAENLTNPEMNNLAAYFAAQKVTPTTHQSSAESQKIGPALTQQYNCTQCHGPALKGIQHIPRLAGQRYEYLLEQLKGFKSHTRYDMDGNMTSAMSAVKETDIPVLADYIAGLQYQ